MRRDSLDVDIVNLSVLKAGGDIALADDGTQYTPAVGVGLKAALDQFEAVLNEKGEKTAGERWWRGSGKTHESLGRAERVVLGLGDEDQLHRAVNGEGESVRAARGGMGKDGQQVTSSYDSSSWKRATAVRTVARPALPTPTRRVTRAANLTPGVLTPSKAMNLSPGTSWPMEIAIGEHEAARTTSGEHNGPVHA